MSQPTGRPTHTDAQVAAHALCKAAHGLDAMSLCLCAQRGRICESWLFLPHAEVVIQALYVNHRMLVSPKRSGVVLTLAPE